MTSPNDGPPFCCDADALINLVRTQRFLRLDILAQRHLLRIPLGVYKEVHLHQRQGAEKRMLEGWEQGRNVVIDLDQDMPARGLLPAIERSYGPPFNDAGLTYPGFWKSKAGHDAADGEVVALAKANRWTVVSNDNSVRGACLLEGIECLPWQSLALVLDREPTQPSLL